MQHHRIGAAVTLTCWLGLAAITSATDGVDDAAANDVSANKDRAATIDFAHDVLPVLQAKCARCHTNGTYKGGFSMDSRAAIVGAGVVGSNPEESELLARIHSDDPELRMPKEGELNANELKLLTRWVRGGLVWEPGFSFRPRKDSAPLTLARPELPPIVEGRDHPVDRLVDAYFAEQQLSWPRSIDDGAFLRRIRLDLSGDLPERAELESFLAEKDPDKRTRTIRLLLDDSIGYADHFITFWNDLLRNDYRGTGYIDGGRQQITTWLYDSLVVNKPYDQFVRELIAPSDASVGFIKGIRWRGRVNASQVTPLQFAQNVSQVMLGINMKCASCHDSFINDWKLRDAYGLAAITSDAPLEIHRCDKPTGEMAQAAFLFPELGTIDPGAPRAERLEQLAALITSPKNGRFARTIVNRVWDRLMGRGLVHPVDVMSNPPWSADLLDYLASDFVEHGYDLKHLLERITTSRIYQSQTVSVDPDLPPDRTPFAGPAQRRMTAEQFQDAVWQLTGTAPAKPAGKFGYRAGRRLRASLVESNLLMRSLGRPNREQVVTTRPSTLTTLQALDLTNGDVLAEQLDRAASRLLGRGGDSVEEQVNDLFLRALSRPATEAEQRASGELLGSDVTAQGLADLYWALLMLPEFQLIR